MATATHQNQQPNAQLQHPSIPRKIQASNASPLIAATKPTNSLYLRECPPSHYAGSDFSRQQFYRVFVDLPYTEAYTDTDGKCFRIFAEVAVKARKRCYFRQFKIVGVDVDGVDIFTPYQRLTEDVRAEIDCTAMLLRHEIRDEVVAKLEELDAIDSGWTFG